MASFFGSRKYSRVASSELEAENNDWKMGYQYTTSPFSSFTRSSRSDSSGSYSSVSSSDSAYEKLAPTAEELSFFDDKALPSTPKERRVRFALEKDLPSLPREAITTSRKPRRVSSRDGAYAWFAQRRYQTTDERLEDSMEKRSF